MKIKMIECFSFFVARREHKNGKIKLEDILQKKKNVEIALKENSQKVFLYLDLKQGLKELNDLVPNESLERLEQSVEKLELEQRKKANIEADMEKKLHEIKELNASLENIKLEQAKSHENYQITEKELHDSIKRLEDPLLQRRREELHKLEEEMHSLECRLERQRGIQDLLSEVNCELFEKKS